MKTLLQLYIASLKEFIREPMTLFWTMAFPILFILIFGLVFSDPDSPSYEIGLAVNDEGPAGEALAEAFRSVPVFEITEGERDDLIEQLKNGDLRTVVVIPDGLSEAVQAGDTAQVETIYDPSNTTSAQIVLAIIRQIVDSVDRGIQNAPVQLEVEATPITAEDAGFIDFFLPGILGMSLMQTGLFGTAPVLVAMREQQILRRLGATPLPRSILLASQVMMRLTIGFAQMAVIIGIGILGFGMNIEQSPLLLIGFVVLGALAFVAMGYMIAGLAKTQDAVNGISSLLNFPMMFLSGIFFPIEVMPEWLRPVVSIIPLTYLGDALRQIIVGAPPAYPLLLDAGVLVGCMVVCGLMALRFFRWE
jgi:ABC-2 type transport system permease protein